MLAHDKSIIHSSDESDWRTPDALFAALDQEFHVQLDAAASVDSTKVSSAWFGPGSPLAENALVTSWAYAGPGTRVFVNPPFSRSKAAALRKAGDAVGARSYDIAAWADKCWRESLAGVTIVAVMPFAPQTAWYRRYVYGHREALTAGTGVWSGHAAKEERRLPKRISFLRPDGSPAANAGVNSAIIVWGPMRGAVGPWTPHSWYWSWE